MNLSSESNASEVGGSEIAINVGNAGNVSVFIFGINVYERHRGIFTCNTIEGDNVSVDCVKADTLRGARVFIGENCNIGRVEYTESCEIENGAKVGESVKV